MIKQLIVFALSFMFFGCNEDVKTDQFQQVGFDNDIELLYEAADEWCEATNGRHCATFEGGENIIQLLNEHDWQTRYPEQQYTVGSIVLKHTGESKILIKSRFNDRTSMKKAIMHELGHHFGCGHVSEIGDIMSVWESERVELSQKDIDCVK
jgi:hypothetical protein